MKLHAEPGQRCGSCWCCGFIKELLDVLAWIDSRMAPVYARAFEESTRTRDSQYALDTRRIARRYMDDWQRQRDPFFKEIVRLTMMSLCMVPRIVITP